MQLTNCLLPGYHPVVDRVATRPKNDRVATRPKNDRVATRLATRSRNERVGTRMRLRDCLIAPAVIPVHSRIGLAPKLLLLPSWPGLSLPSLASSRLLACLLQLHAATTGCHHLPAAGCLAIAAKRAAPSGWPLQ